MLLVRGERPILDEKYDLHKDVTIDTRRLDDYELLSAGEILGREQSF